MTPSPALVDDMPKVVDAVSCENDDRFAQSVDHSDWVAIVNRRHVVRKARFEYRVGGSCLSTERYRGLELLLSFVHS